MTKRAKLHAGVQATPDQNQKKKYQNPKDPDQCPKKHHIKDQNRLVFHHIDHDPVHIQHVVQVHDLDQALDPLIRTIHPEAAQLQLDTLKSDTIQGKLNNFH